MLLWRESVEFIGQFIICLHLQDNKMFKSEEVGGPSVGFGSGFGPPSVISKSINCGLMWACFRPQMSHKGAICLTGPDTKSCNQSINHLL